MTRHPGMDPAYFLCALIALNAAYALYVNEFRLFFIAMMVSLLTIIPTIAASRIHIQLPWFLLFLVALSLWFNSAGGALEYALPLHPYYDTIAHLVSGITVALPGLLGLIFLVLYWEIKLTPGLFMFFTIIFGMAVGSFLEITLFAVDRLFGNVIPETMQADNTRVMRDLIVVFIGSCITAIYGVVWFGNNSREEIFEVEG